MLYEPADISSGASIAAVGAGALGAADERESVDSSSRDEAGSLSIHATVGSHMGARTAHRPSGTPPMGSATEKELRTSRI